jgi:hypothetical protein
MRIISVANGASTPAAAAVLGAGVAEPAAAALIDVALDKSRLLSRHVFDLP